MAIRINNLHRISALSVSLMMTGLLLLPSFSSDASAAGQPFASNLEAQGNKSQYLGESGLTRDQMNAMRQQQATQPRLTPPPANFTPECPASLHCVFKPAAYQANSSTLNDFGNYNLANRPHDESIDQIIIHTTEGSLGSAISHFQDSQSYVSAHYIVGKDGSVTQMVRLQDVAYQAGDWYVNTHSIGIEHEGYAESTPMTTAEYNASAALTKWLSQKFNVSRDRSHIIGHDNVAAPTDATLRLQHWDPGPYFDWTKYMSLIGGSNGPITSNAYPSPYVTFTPEFATNLQATTNCTAQPCQKVAARPSNFIPLYSAPSTSASLLKDPYVSNAGTDDQADWGDKAPTGFSYAVAERRTGWTAIWFDGQKAWFKDTGTQTTDSAGIVITPKTDKAVPVYGRPVPESSAADWQKLPEALRVKQVALTDYTIKAGQEYAVAGSVVNDYYAGCQNVSCTYQGDTSVIVGGEKYLSIFYNHRIMYIKVSDMQFNYKG